MSDLIFLYIHNFISFFNGGTNGQPPMAAMAAMAGLLNVLLMDVKQLLASNNALHLVAISTDALVV